MFFNLAQASSLFFLFFYLLHFAFVVFVWVDMIKETKKGFLSILSHTREIVVTCNFLTVLYLRSFHIIYFTLTAATTVISAKILKKILKHPRPIPPNRKRAVKKSYGMPSSHSAAICFLTTYLQCMFSTASEGGALTSWQNIIVLLFFHGFSLAVVWSRVRLGHHTKTQVIAGSLFGLSMALIAYSLWHFYFSTLDLDGHVNEAFTSLFKFRTR